MFACGDVTGFAGTDAAARAGAAAGRALASTLATLAMVAASRAPRWSRSGCADVRAAAPAGRAAPRPTRRAAAPTRSSRRRSPARRARDAREPRRRAHGRGAGRSWTPRGRLVRDKHYDKTLGGVDWNAVRAQVRAAGARRAFRGRVLPRAEPDDRRAGPVAHDDHRPGRRGRRRRRAPATGRAPGPGADLSGDPGLTVRVIEDGRPSRACAPARRPTSAGLRPGFIVTQIAGRPLRAAARSGAPAAPGRGALRDPPGARSSGCWGRPARRCPCATSTIAIGRARRCWCAIRPRRRRWSSGHLPPLYPEVRAYEIGDVGVVSVQHLPAAAGARATSRARWTRFRAHHVRARSSRSARQPGRPGRDGDPDRRRCS